MQDDGDGDIRFLAYVHFGNTEGSGERGVSVKHESPSRKITGQLHKARGRSMRAKSSHIPPVYFYYPN